jgi:Prolyl oligopeptidase family
MGVLGSIDYRRPVTPLGQADGACAKGKGGFMTRPRFKNDDFEFGYEMALGSVYRGYADAGEVQATVARIKDGDADAWVAQWSATAEAMESAAQDAEAEGHRVSAHGLYQRSASYYSTALYLITHSNQASRQPEIWRRHRACWDKAVDLASVPGERIEIPYEGTTLPGYFFRAPDTKPGEQRPLVVINNGSDGATSSMALFGGIAANERGYHLMTFDGPGQQAALFLQNIPFRPDWEAVLPPVFDAMVSRPDVDADRVAVIGISQGGYWVPRALAFEHRFVAAVIDPGVVDVSTSWTAQLPGFMTSQLKDESKKKAFDQEMGWAERLSKSNRATLHFRAEPFGVESDSRWDLYQQVMKYKLGDEVKNITTPVLITSPEDEQFWPGQSQHLYQMLSGEKQLVSFTAAEGANRHCEPMGLGIRDARIYDWLDGHLRTRPV